MKGGNYMANRINTKSLDSIILCTDELKKTYNNYSELKDAGNSKDLTKQTMILTCLLLGLQELITDIFV